MRQYANRGGNVGRMGGTAQGPGGECKCPRCGYTKPHATASPCMANLCPYCMLPLTRA